MKREIHALVLAAALASAPFAVAAAGDLDGFKGLKGEIKIAGGTAHIPVMKEAARRAMTLNPDLQVSVAGGGSGVGIKQAGEGLVDIGNSGRAPTDQEISRYGLRVFQWALDGVGIVVHPKNAVTALTQTQLMAIYSGKTTNWKDVGGADQQINIYTRDESSGTREVFWEKALKKGPIAGHAHFIVSNGAMKSAVSQDPYGIGYVSVGHIDETVKAVILDGVPPTQQTVKDGRYPVARGLYSVTKGDPSGPAKSFIDYLFSPEGQGIAAGKGFIPVR